MTRFTVHLFREMRLSFAGIEADTPQAAAAIARETPTDDADNIEDCDGETLAALVDTAGDDDDRQSVTIDFERERARKAATVLLDALEGVLAYAENEAESLESLKVGPESEAEAEQAWKAVKMARSALARANGTDTAKAEIDIHGLLASRRQVAAIWGVEDVREIRPDLGEEQTWEVLRQADRHQDDATAAASVVEHQVE